MEMDLKIDREFQEKTPPLTEEEFKQLRENILEDGEIYEPIIVWNGVIVDGHNRYRVIKEHPEIPYRVKQMDFADRWAAIIAALVYACKVLWDGWTDASADIEPIEWEDWNDR